MVRLYILGSAELRDADGRLEHSFLAGPKRLALLVYLVLNRPRGFQRRDQVLPLFWPDHGQKSARNALSNMLYHMRRALGQDAIRSRGAEELAVDPGTLWCDALAFERALAEDRPREAHALYRGDLLGGLHIPDTAPDLDRWLEHERDRLRRGYWDALEALAGQAEAHGEPEAAVAWWRVRAEEDPYDARVVRRLVEASAATGHRAEALRRARSYARLVEEELGADPEAEVRKLTEGLAAAAPPLSTANGTASDEPTPRAIAVLPFEALGEGRTAGFTEGIHGDLLTRLAGIADLQVISRTSVRRYRGSKKTVAQIGAELDAPWVLEGEVQEAADRVQVNVRLVEARTHRQVWAGDYRQTLSAENLFEIQGAITKEIVRSLEAEFTPEEVRRVEQQPTANLDAYRLYALGRRFLDERTEDGIRRALDYFEQALAQDPSYALAWVGLADAHLMLHDYGYEAAHGVLPRAEAAIGRALELDPNSAEASASLGNLHIIRHEGPAALRELQRAVELRPSYADAHNWLSWLGNLLGLRQEALASAWRAVALNPLSPEVVSNLALSYLANGELERGLTEAQRDRELGSSWGTGRFYEGLALYELGRFEDAVGVLRGLAAPWAGEGPRATLAVAHVAAGDRAGAREVLDEIEATGDRFATGLVLAALGEREQAFDAFRRTGRLHHWPTLAVRHFYRDVWDELGGDRRHEYLLREVDQSWGMGGSASHS